MVVKKSEKKKSKQIKKGKKEKSVKRNGKKQIKLLKSVVEDLINKQSVEIIDLLAEKKNVNEFIIAKNLDLTINQTRNILYKLSDYGLVSFIRKKDKRKGWYIYFWTLDSFQALDLLEENLKKKLDILESQVNNRKRGRHYLCNTCSIEVNEENALLNDFVCPECEDVYDLSDDSDVVVELERRISKLKKEIDLVTSEKDIEGSKVEKEKSKKIKKAEDEKRAIKEKAAKKRKALRLKEKKAEEKLKNKDKKVKEEKKVKKGSRKKK